MSLFDEKWIWKPFILHENKTQNQNDARHAPCWIQMKMWMLNMTLTLYLLSKYLLPVFVPSIALVTLWFVQNVNGRTWPFWSRNWSPTDGNGSNPGPEPESEKTWPSYWHHIHKSCESTRGEWENPIKYGSWAWDAFSTQRLAHSPAESYASNVE